MTVTDTNDPIELAKGIIREALAPYFKGSRNVKRHKNATEDVLEAVSHLVKTSPAPKNRLGATVMTESASQRNPHTGNHNVPPRIM